MAVKCGKKKRNGKPCEAWAIEGGSVCRMHGGGAPQVKRSAALRLAMMVDPALEVLLRTVRQKKDKKLAFAAAQDVLNRNGYKSYDEIKIKGSGPEEATEMNQNDPRERILSRIAQMADPKPEGGSSPGSDGQGS
jgi:hypothetical protein